MTIKRVIALILVFALLAAGLWYMRKVDAEDKARMRELYSQVEPLQRQRDNLAAELDSLETEYALRMRDAGTVQVLFRELDDILFTEVYPLMRERGLTGVLGLSLAEYIGYARRIDLNQFNRLMMDGWGCCLVFDKGYGFDLWYNSMLRLLQRDGIEMPKAIFFPDDTYNSSLDEKLIACGFDTVIVSAPDGRTNTVTPVDGDLWFTGAMPWNYTGMSSDTEILARTNGANLVFTVSFRNLWDAYDRSSFVKILDKWNSMQEKDEVLESLLEPTPTPAASGQGPAPAEELQKPLLRVTTFGAAREAHLQAENSNAMLLCELEERRTELNAQIDALDAQIRELYDQWNETGKPSITDWFFGLLNGERNGE